VALKKLDKLSKDRNARDRLYMNKFTALEKDQNSTFIPKNKPFVNKANDQGKQGPTQVRNALAPTNVVEQDESSSKDEQSDNEESEDEGGEQANIVEN